MDDLIAALTIFRKYTDSLNPTGCDHDVLYVYVDPLDVTDEDLEQLEKLGFFAEEDDEHFYSYRFGSA